MRWIRFLFGLFARRDWVASQLERPHGWWGRHVFAKFLDEGNGPLMDFAVVHANASATDKVLEIGFGTGALIERLVPSGAQIAGADFSADMVSLAGQRLAKEVQAGQVTLHEASVSELPFTAAEFDTVVSCNTVYFFPYPLEDAQEILRVLKPAGRLVVGFRPRMLIEQVPFVTDRFTLYSAEEIISLFEQAGFSEVEVVHRQESVGFDSYCLVATK